MPQVMDVSIYIHDLVLSTVSYIAELFCKLAAKIFWDKVKETIPYKPLPV